MCIFNLVHEAPFTGTSLAGHQGATRHLQTPEAVGFFFFFLSSRTHFRRGSLEVAVLTSRSSVTSQLVLLSSVHFTAKHNRTKPPDSKVVSHSFQCSCLRSAWVQKSWFSTSAFWDIAVQSPDITLILQTSVGIF